MTELLLPHLLLYGRYLDRWLTIKPSETKIQACNCFIIACICLLAFGDFPLTCKYKTTSSMYPDAENSIFTCFKWFKSAIVQSLGNPHCIAQENITSARVVLISLNKSVICRRCFGSPKCKCPLLNVAIIRLEI